jgi:hypothetical protein
MQPQQRLGGAVEDVERGAGAWVDFEQECFFAIHQEVGRGEPDDLEASSDGHDG